MKNPSPNQLSPGRSWVRSGTLLGRSWHLRLDLAEVGASPCGGAQLAAGEHVGTDTLSPCPELALHYDFVQAFLDGPVLTQRHCRIRVYRPDGRRAPHPQVYPTVVVCSPLEVDCDQHLAPIATVVWHTLGRPSPLTWIAHEWVSLPEDCRSFEECLLRPEFWCIQFWHEGRGILSSPTFYGVTRGEVEALVGPIEMLRIPGGLPRPYGA